MDFVMEKIRNKFLSFERDRTRVVAVGAKFIFFFGKTGKAI
jgi:hypothetical protein